MLPRTSDGGSAANARLVDGNTGKCEPTVDGLPLVVHMGIVDLLEAAAQRAFFASCARDLSRAAQAG